MTVTSQFTVLFCFLLMAASKASANETIVDPELMNHDVWSEPYFPSEEEISREPSNESPREHIKNNDEYLDVLKKIPASEPTISRNWLEYKIIHEN